MQSELELLYQHLENSWPVRNFRWRFRGTDSGENALSTWLGTSTERTQSYSHTVVGHFMPVDIV